jgi:hypothetical protein
MKLIDRIKGESTPNNRRKGQLKTVIAGVLTTVSTSGLIDDKPLIKTAVDLFAGILVRDIFNHATTVNK